MNSPVGMEGDAGGGCLGDDSDQLVAVQEELALVDIDRLQAAAGRHAARIARLPLRRSGFDAVCLGCACLESYATWAPAPARLGPT